MKNLRSLVAAALLSCTPLWAQEASTTKWQPISPSLEQLLGDNWQIISSGPTFTETRRIDGTAVFIQPEGFYFILKKGARIVWCGVQDFEISKQIASSRCRLLL